MEQINLLLEGFSHALTPMNLLWVLLGALLGTAVGVLPGLGSAMAVALLLPITFSLDPTAAFIMFAGVYYGGLFGDSTSGILLNTPGNSSAIASTFEGHRMARSGLAAKALATAAVGAFIGGLLATTVVVFFAPTLVKLATAFGPAEYFALAVFAFLAISSVVSESIIKGLPQPFDGISIVVITVGLLALGEMLHIASASTATRMPRRSSPADVPACTGTTSRKHCLHGRAVPLSARPSASSPLAVPRFRPSWPTAPKSAWPSAAAISSSARWARSAVWLLRKQPRTRRPVPPWAHCWRWACRPRRLRPS